MEHTRDHIMKGLAYLSGSNMLQRVFSLATFIIVIRALSLQDYGSFTLLISLTGPLVAFISLSIGGIISTEISISKNENNLGRIKKMLKNYAWMHIIIFVIISFLSYFLSDFIIRWRQIPLVYGSYLFLILAFGLFQAALNFIMNILKSFEAFKEVAVSESLEPISRFVFILMALIFWQLNLFTVFLAYILSKGVVVIASSYLGRRIFDQIISSKISEKSELYGIVRAHGKWTIIRNILAQFTGAVRFWLIQIFLNAESVAIFSVVSKILSFTTKLFPLQYIVTPIVARKYTDKNYVSVLIRKTRKYYILYFTAVSLGIWAFRDLLLQVASPQYADYGILLGVLSFSLIIEAFSSGQIAILYAFRRQKFLFWEFIGRFSVNILISAVLLNFFGLFGLAIAVIINILIMFIIRELYISRVLKFSLLKIKDYVSFDYYDRMVLDRIKSFLPKFLTR